MIKDTNPSGVKIHVPNSYKELVNGSRRVKKVSRGIDEWAYSHHVIIFNKIENFYDVTVVFAEKSDYTLFALTWTDGEYEFLYTHDGLL